MGRSSTFCMVSKSVRPRNSRRPVSASHSTTPRANTSDRRSTGVPFTCSGDRYGSLPLQMPVSVSSPTLKRPWLLAIPKSSSFTPPARSSMMFDGVTSRWTRFSGSPPGSVRLWA